VFNTAKSGFIRKRFLLLIGRKRCGLISFIRDFAVEAWLKQTKISTHHKRCIREVHKRGEI
jgi:hypothetical protein